MKLKLMFHYKGGKVEMSEQEVTGLLILPRIKEEVFIDETHKGIVFNIIHLLAQEEIVIKIR